MTKNPGSMVCIYCIHYYSVSITYHYSVCSVMYCKALLRLEVTTCTAHMIIYTAHMITYTNLLMYSRQS